MKRCRIQLLPRWKLSIGNAVHRLKVLFWFCLIFMIDSIVGICLGVPPKEFTWECYDKSKEYKTIGPLTPLTFYLEHVKPTFDVDTKVCDQSFSASANQLVNWLTAWSLWSFRGCSCRFAFCCPQICLVSDPRPQNPVGKTYTVDCLGNMVEGRKTIYCNQPIETLIELTAKAIQEGHPVWFGCDVSQGIILQAFVSTDDLFMFVQVAKHFASKQGLMDVDIHDHSLVYGTSVRNISKADRLIYGDSVMNHAMLFTGVTIDEVRRTIKAECGNGALPSYFLCIMR